jgi:hypothetical protein
MQTTIYKTEAYVHEKFINFWYTSTGKKKRGLGMSNIKRSVHPDRDEEYKAKRSDTIFRGCPGTYTYQHFFNAL